MQTDAAIDSSETRCGETLQDIARPQLHALKTASKPRNDIYF